MNDTNNNWSNKYFVPFVLYELLRVKYMTNIVIKMNDTNNNWSNKYFVPFVVFLLYNVKYMWRSLKWNEYY
jgi:hypothetical protein